MENTFFPGARRRVELEDWRPLMNEQGDRRIRLDLLMPLTGQAILGMPTFVSAAYERMDVEDSAIKDVDLFTELEGITVEGYATDQSKPLELEWGVGLDEAEAQAKEAKRKLLLTGCTLRSFKLVRVTRDKMAIVALRLSVSTKSDVALVIWAHRYHGATFWAEFTATQGEIGDKPSEEAQMELGDDMPTLPDEQRAAIQEIETRPRGRRAAARNI